MDVNPILPNISRILMAFVLSILADAEVRAASVTYDAGNEELAEEFSLYSDFAGVIDITGTIEDGDAEKLEELVAVLKPEQRVSGASGLGLVLRLDSPGGSFKEAIDIARVIKKYKLQTFVPRGAECLSACAVIFMAGTYQPGFRQQEIPWRKVEWPALLGFHRPFFGELVPQFSPGMFQELPEQEIKGFFSDSFIAAFDTANQLIQQMVGVHPPDWSPELLVRMLTASGDDQFVYLETVDDALTWGIEILNAQPPRGASPVDLYTQNFWLCYNAGRAIPAYSGIWPERPVAEETLQYDLLNCCGRQGAQWHSKMIEDDNLTYYTRIRGWYFGCTITYPHAEAKPTVTFFHDESTFTRTHFLQHYNPGTVLDRVTNALVPRQGAHEGGGSEIGAEVIRGRCLVFSGARRIDDEPCRRTFASDARHGLVENYLWPSGSRTVVTRRAGAMTVNGAPASLDIGDRRNMEFCLKSSATRNTFCFAKGDG